MKGGIFQSAFGIAGSPAAGTVTALQQKFNIHGVDE